MNSIPRHLMEVVIQHHISATLPPRIEDNVIILICILRQTSMALRETFKLLLISVFKSFVRDTPVYILHPLLMNCFKERQKHKDILTHILHICIV